MSDLTPEALTTLTCHGCDTTWNAGETTSPGEPELCADCWETDAPTSDDMFGAWVGAGWAE